MRPRLLILFLFTFAIVAAVLGFQLYEDLVAARLQASPKDLPTLRLLATIAFGASRATVIVANPYTDQVFAAQEDVPALANIDAHTNRITKAIPLRGYHTGMAIDVVANEIYVTQEFSQTVRVINGKTNEIARELPVPGGSPLGELAFDSNRNLLYVIQNDIGRIAILEKFRGDVVGTLPINAHYGDLALNPQTERLYVTNPLDNQVTVVDTATETIVATIPVGNNPTRIEVNPVTNRVYVSISNDGVIAVIDGATNRVVKTIAVGKSPVGLAVNGATNRIYVAESENPHLTIIDGLTEQVLTQIPLETPPGLIALLPDLGRIYVSSGEGHGVYVVQDQAPVPATASPVLSDENARVWRVNGGELPADWNQPEFDDSGWAAAAPGACLSGAPLDVQKAGKWIWLPGCNQHKETVLVRKKFILPIDTVQGTLRIRAADTGRVFVNGHALGETRVWTTEYWYDLAPFLREGTNVLAIQVNHDHDGGYGAVIFEAEVSRR